MVAAESGAIAGTVEPLFTHSRSIYAGRSVATLSDSKSRSARCAFRTDSKGRLLEGDFRPGGLHREWVHPEVLQQLRRRTLARLRREVAPLEARVLGAFLPRWQGVGSKRRGLDALLDAIETLQGMALPVSEWEREILPARIKDYDPSDLDTLMTAGEVVWVGRGQLGEHDGRVALYLAESLPALLPPSGIQSMSPPEGRAQRSRSFLTSQGALTGDNRNSRLATFRIPDPTAN